MNPDELLEQQLRKLKPAAPPEDFTNRVIDAYSNDSHLFLSASPAPRSQTLFGNALGGETPFRSGAEHKVLQQDRRGASKPAQPHWLTLLFRWSAYTAATALVILAAARIAMYKEHAPPQTARAAIPAGDNVEVNKRVLGKFDGGVVELPDGRVVQLNCYLVDNKVSIKDNARGVLVEQSTPRLEIMPVTLTVY